MWHKWLRRIVRGLTFAALVAGLLRLEAASACSCADPPLTSRYEAAKTLLLVKAGPTVKEQRETGGEVRRWPFEILEQYRGKAGFEQLWSEGGGASCGARLAEGVHYLISTDDSGRISLCSVRRVGEGRGVDKDVEVLNAYKSGEIPELTEPWIFSESTEACYLSHQFTYGSGHLQFFYRFREPEHLDTRQYEYPLPVTVPGGRDIRHAIEDRGAHPSTVPGFMHLRVRFIPGRHVLENSGRVVIGDNVWTTRRTLMDAPWGSPYEVVDEEGAGEILTALSDASSVSIRWSLWELPAYRRKHYPEYPEASASTSYLYFGDATERFQACVERGVTTD